MSNICEILLINKVSHFLTGSRAFFPEVLPSAFEDDDVDDFFVKLRGTITKKDTRDWDVCILNQDMDNVHKILELIFDVVSIRDCDYSKGKVYYLKNTVMNEFLTINIIPLTTAQFLSWHFATNSMMQFEPSKYTNKEDRVRTFELLCLASKGMYGYGNVSFAGTEPFEVAKQCIRKHLKNIGTIKTNVIIA